MNDTTYPVEYKGWQIQFNYERPLVGRRYRTLFTCYAISPGGQTTEKAISDDADTAYKATCERVDRIEEARK